MCYGLFGLVIAGRVAASGRRRSSIFNAAPGVRRQTGFQVIGKIESAATKLGSSNNVGRQLVLELRKLVPQKELAFFQPLQLELVRLAGLAQPLDCGVEIAMFLAQAFDLGDESSAFLLRELLVIHVRSRFPAPSRVNRRAYDYGRATALSQGAAAPRGNSRVPLWPSRP